MTIELPPEPPEKPAPEECCGSGCDPCVFEVYEQQLEDYRRKLEAWQRRQACPRESGDP
jgi:hypothetical protein